MLRRCCPPLAEDAVHVWHQRTDRFDQDPAFVDAFHKLLSPGEQTRFAQIRRPGDRFVYLLSRAMMRTVLAQYVDSACENLAFGANDFGKPILTPSERPAVHFNLTHSRGAIALAVSATCEVGIDIEDRYRAVEFRALADRFFSEPEACYLRGLEGERLRDAFFAIWTLKEAFVKGIGRGLSFPLDAFCFDLDVHRLIAFRPLADYVATDWGFRQFELDDQHSGALAIRGRHAEEVCVQFYEWDAHFGTDATTGEGERS